MRSDGIWRCFATKSRRNSPRSAKLWRLPRAVRVRRMAGPTRATRMRFHHHCAARPRCQPGGGAHPLWTPVPPLSPVRSRLPVRVLATRAGRMPSQARDSLPVRAGPRPLRRVDRACLSIAPIGRVRLLPRVIRLRARSSPRPGRPEPGTALLSARDLARLMSESLVPRAVLLRVRGSLPRRPGRPEPEARRRAARSRLVLGLGRPQVRLLSRAARSRVQSLAWSVPEVALPVRGLLLPWPGRPVSEAPRSVARVRRVQRAGGPRVRLRPVSLGRRPLSVVTRVLPPGFRRFRLRCRGCPSLRTGRRMRVRRRRIGVRCHNRVRCCHRCRHRV